MSTVWHIRSQVLQRQIEELAERLSAAQPPSSVTITEHTIRLLAGTAMLIQQHRVNEHGQCKFCDWTRGRFWRRRPRCTVYRAACFAMDQGLDVVWWQLLTSVGKKRSLMQVRQWVAERDTSHPAR